MINKQKTKAFLEQWKKYFPCEQFSVNIKTELFVVLLPLLCAVCRWSRYIQSGFKRWNSDHTETVFRSWFSEWEWQKCVNKAKSEKEEKQAFFILFFTGQDTLLRFFLPLVFLSRSSTIKTGSNFRVLRSPSGKFYPFLSRFFLSSFLRFHLCFVFCVNWAHLCLTLLSPAADKIATL